MAKTFRNSPAVPNRASFSITSSLMETLSFSNISDTAPNASITIGTTFTSPSTTFLFLFSRNWDFSIFSSSVFYSWISTDSDVYDLSLLCPLINKDDFRPSTSYSHYTFKSHRTLKPVFPTMCSGVCLYHWSARSSSAHTVANAHTAPHCYVASCTHVGLTGCTHLLGDLHFFPSLRSSLT